MWFTLFVGQVGHHHLASGYSVDGHLATDPAYVAHHPRAGDAVNVDDLVAVGQDREVDSFLGEIGQFTQVGPRDVSQLQSAEGQTGQANPR